MAAVITIDRANFEDFYLRHYQMVYRICFAYMKNSYDAEDCTQDTFIKVLKGSFSFNGPKHEEAWLTVTAMNVCRDHLKQFWHRKVTVDENIEARARSSDKAPDYLLEEIMSLPAKYKDVIYLHYYLGYKTEEIAVMLNRPGSTVRNQLAAGRKLLRSLLEDEQ